MKKLFNALLFWKTPTPAPKNFGQIVETFNTVVLELSDLEARNADQAQRNANEIVRLEKAKAALENEANRARNVRTKIKDLISA